MPICRYGLVSGVVQGVGFRAHAQRVATRAGLSGYARNLPDGRVEVLLCGEKETVAKVETEIAKGPPAARVDRVMWEERECRPQEGFSRG